MKLKSLLFTSLLLGTTLAFSEIATEQNNTIENNTIEIKKESFTEEKNILLQEKVSIEKELLDNNIWSKIYSNYHTYQELKKREHTLNSKIKHL
jgi:uncharacterized protein YifE (UPF0438 family)